MKNLRISLCVALCIALSGCTSVQDLVLGDSGNDIVTPTPGEKFTPAVGYMPQCLYSGTVGGNFFTYNADNVVAESACLQAAAALASMPGLTFKSGTVFEGPNGPARYFNARQRARAGGAWIDTALEQKVGAQYRFVFELPDVVVSQNSKALSFRFAVQRVRDGKIMKVQHIATGERSAAAAASNFATAVQKVLLDPANAPPLWFTPF